MTALTLIPSSETLVFSKLPDSIKEEVTVWLNIVKEMESARNKSQAANDIARRFTGVRGFSADNIGRKYRAYKKHGWRVLIDDAKLPKSCPVAPQKKQGQPPAFIEYWKALQENYQRNSLAAYRELIRRYRQNETQIPGIGNWRNVWIDTHGSNPPKVCPLDAPLPEGWGGNGRNLMRYQPNKFELTSSRIGLGAAKKFRPQVYTTRVGMEPGQVYVFDDMWHPNKVNFLGVNSKAMIPLEFSCLDLFSACQITWGAHPMTMDEFNKKREALRDSEMRFILVDVLCVKGYHKAGCCLHVENATAAISKELEELLFHWTGGAVTVRRAGIRHAAVHDGFFVGRGKGNPQFKAALESLHNLKQNELAHLPGQVGKDRDHSPEQMGDYADSKTKSSVGSIEHYNQTLLKAMEQMPERAMMLEFPFLEYNQWKQIVGAIYQRINERTDHDIEGWVEAGLVQNRFQLNPGGEPIPMERLLGMTKEQRVAVEALMIPMAPRKLSPAEVWERGKKNLIRLAPHYVPMILGRQNAKELPVLENFMFEFKDRRMGPGHHRYIARVTTEHGEQLMLEPGEKYLLYSTPFDPSAAFIADKDNSFIGIAQAITKPCKTDTDAIHRENGRIMALEKELLSGVKARHMDEARAKQKMHTNNVAVMRGDPVTAEEHEELARIRKANRSMADMYPSAPDQDDYEEEADETPTRNFADMYGSYEDE